MLGRTNVQAQSNMPLQFFQCWGHNKELVSMFVWFVDLRASQQL